MENKKNKDQKNKIENDFKFLLETKFGHSIIEKIESQKYLHVVSIAQYFFHKFSSYLEDSKKESLLEKILWSFICK